MAETCAAEQNGMERCDADHLARRVACTTCARIAGLLENDCYSHSYQLGALEARSTFTVRVAEQLLEALAMKGTRGKIRREAAAAELRAQLDGMRELLRKGAR